MKKKSTISGLTPDKLASLWNIASEENESTSIENPPIGDIPVIKGYELHQKLGEGGMGAVWRATQLSTQQQVALKILNTRTFGSNKALMRFEREVEFSARLKHPNITRIFDSGLQQGMYYYAMELIEGQHLDEYVKLRGLSIRDTLELMQTICQAVMHAHQLGIIHRDLKPSNILVSEDGQPHILDFGVAKQLSEAPGQQTLSIEGEIIGTLQYMAPEQAIGQSELVDIRADVYSLGVISYRLLTGQYPYEIIGSTLEALQNIQNAEPIRPKQLIPKLDSDIEAILLKSLQKDPSRRYQSAGELEYDINCWLNGFPIVARSVSSIYLLRIVITRHRYTSSVIGLLLLIVLAFLYVSYDLYLSAKKSQQESEALAVQWESESSANLLFARKITFSLFLQAWKQDNLQQARGIATFMAESSKERYAANFLLISDLEEDTETTFRQGIPEEQSWFADYIVGGYFEKMSDHQKALELYQKSKQAVSQLSDDSFKEDKWLIEQLNAAFEKLQKSKNE